MNTQPDSKQELLDSENNQESQKFIVDSEIDKALEQMYAKGNFEFKPRRLKKHKSGLVISFLVLRAKF